MALKAFLQTLAINTGAGPGSDPSEVVGYVTVSLGYYVPLYENGTLLMDPTDSSLPFPTSGINAAIHFSDTLVTLKAKIQAAYVSRFNEVTGRTDGNTIQFVWLDDRGIL